MTTTTPKGQKTKPIYMPHLCTRSAGVHIGKPWQPFSYVVRQERGMKPGTHHKSQDQRISMNIWEGFRRNAMHALTGN